MNPKTWILAAVAAFFLLLNTVDRGSGARLAATLPVLSSIDRSHVTRIELATAIGKVVLERVHPPDPEAGDPTVRDIGRWKITAPVESPADQVQVRSLLGAFRKEVPMDVQVDSSELATYGLEPGKGLAVELWTDDAMPSLSVILGKDGPGGTSFLRLPGSDAIYRAQLGGRHRFDRSPTEWQNKVMLGFAKEQVASIRIDPPNRTAFELARGVSPAEGGPGPWQMVPRQAWDVDQLRADSLAHDLGRLRASALLGADFEGGFTPPLATARIVLASGKAREIQLGTRNLDGAAVVRVDDRVGKVARSGISGLLLGIEDLQDKTLFNFAREEVDTLSLTDAMGTVLLQQDLSTRMWRVLQPRGVDIDVKNIFYAVNTLATLRTSEMIEGSPAERGLDHPFTRITATLLDGSSRTLLIGQETEDGKGRAAWTAQREGDNRLGTLTEAVVARLRQGFGRN